MRSSAHTPAEELSKKVVGPRRGNLKGNTMDDFDRHFSQTRKLIFLGLIVKLAFFVLLCGLGVFAIHAVVTVAT